MRSTRALPGRLRAFALTAATAACLVFAAAPTPALAQSTASDASMLSGLSLAVSVTAPVMFFAGGATLVVASVEAAANGTVWVLERVSDGARATVRMSTRAAGGASVAVGTSVLVTAMASGYLLSAAGKAIAFVPNELGASLLYNERVSQ